MLSDLGLRKVRASRFFQQFRILDIRVRHFIIILHTQTLTINDSEQLRYRSCCFLCVSLGCIHLFFLTSIFVTGLKVQIRGAANAVTLQEVQGVY